MKRQMTTTQDARESTALLNAVSTPGTSGGECLYCRLEHERLELGICTGIITDDIEECQYIVPKRRICSPKCLIAYLRYIYIPPRERTSIEAATMAMLRDVYGQDYRPIAARDFEDLKKNGGSLTREEWASAEHEDTAQCALRTVKIISGKANHLLPRKT